MRGVARAEIAARVAEALALVQLTGLDARRPLELSGGQRQRVALARALVIRPAVLLLDEPLSNLDLKLREDMRLEISALQRRLGTTTILVTHDQSEALVMSDRVAVMNHGVLAQVADPATIYGRPADRFVADFIGAMNFLPARSGRLAAPGSMAAVRVGDQTVQALAPQGLDAGQAALLAFRPERAVLDGMGEVLLQGRVVRLAFLGGRTELHLVLADGTPCVAEVPNDGRSAHPAEGQAVSVMVAAADCTAFPG